MSLSHRDDAYKLHARFMVMCEMGRHAIVLNSHSLTALHAHLTHDRDSYFIWVQVEEPITNSNDVTNIQTVNLQSVIKQ